MARVMLPAQALSEPSVLHCDFAVETEEVDSVTVSTEPFLLEVQQSAVNGSESDSVTGVVLVDQVVEDYSLGAVIRPPEGADGMRTAKVLSVQGLVDTSADTVIPKVLVKDYTAHDAEGKPVVGELDVDAVRDEGYTEGQTAGYNSGYAEGKTEGIEIGKQAEYDAFWDAMLLNGARRAFGKFGADVYIPSEIWRKPKYPIIMEGDGRFFLENFGTPLSSKSGGTGDYANPFDLSLWQIDSSGVVYGSYFMDNASVENVSLDLSNATTLDYSFRGGDRGVKDNIEIKVSEKCTSYYQTFYWAATDGKRKDVVRFAEGSVIAGQSLNLSYCPQSKSSIISTINALSQSVNYAITLRLESVNKAFETSEGAMDGSTSDEWLALAATKANWTISLFNA
jgi:hypothetical protein